MARASEEQVKKLERDHKAQFVDLVLANKLFISLLPKLKGKSKTSKEYIAMLAFGKKIAQLAGKWYARQWKFEQKAGVPKADKDIMKYFLQPANQDKLIAQAKAFLSPGKKENQILSIYGIGIVPLIVWGVMALIAAFTAYEIVDELNTTAEEKTDLLKQTESTLKDLNITGAQAANIISSTQEQASEGSTGFSFGKLLMWGALAWGGYEFIVKPMQAKSQSK